MLWSGEPAPVGPSEDDPFPVALSGLFCRPMGDDPTTRFYSRATVAPATLFAWRLGGSGEEARLVAREAQTPT